MKFKLIYKLKIPDMKPILSGVGIRKRAMLLGHLTGNQNGLYLMVVSGIMAVNVGMLKMWYLAMTGKNCSRLNE